MNFENVVLIKNLSNVFLMLENCFFFYENCFYSKNKKLLLHETNSQENLYLA